jgi:hypothetical protein
VNGITAFRRKNDAGITKNQDQNIVKKPIENFATKKIKLKLTNF